MKSKTKKSSKLRDFVCVICNKPFQNRLSPSEIKQGKGKVCSRVCHTKYSREVNRRGFFKKCLVCEKPFWCRPSEDKKRTHCSKACSLLRPIKTKRDGKKFISLDGYLIVRTPDGQMKEHRWIMEQHLGRKLKSSEIVHHTNGNRLDNRLENLEVMTRAEHNRHHFGRK